MTVQWLPLDIISLWFASILWLNRKDTAQYHQVLIIIFHWSVVDMSFILKQMRLLSLDNFLSRLLLLSFCCIARCFFSTRGAKLQKHLFCFRNKGLQTKVGCFLLLANLSNFISFMVKLPVRRGKVMNLLNTTCSCRLRTGLTSGSSPLLLSQSAFFYRSWRSPRGQ